MSTDSNRADISTFEQLQANQNDKTGASQMAVFNDLNAVKAASSKIIKDRIERNNIYKQTNEALMEQSDDRIEQVRKDIKRQYDILDTENQKRLEAIYSHAKNVLLPEIRNEVNRINTINDPAERSKERKNLVGATQFKSLSYQVIVSAVAKELERLK